MDEDSRCGGPSCCYHVYVSQQQQHFSCRRGSNFSRVCGCTSCTGVCRLYPAVPSCASVPQAERYRGTAQSGTGVQLFVNSCEGRRFERPGSHVDIIALMLRSAGTAQGHHDNAACGLKDTAGTGAGDGAAGGDDCPPNAVSAHTHEGVGTASPTRAF